MAQRGCKSFQWKFNGRIGLWKLQLYCSAVNGMQHYKKKSEMPSAKHRALAAFNESKQCSREGDFADWTKTLSMNWVRNNQMLQVTLQGKRKLLLHCILDKQVLSNTEIPQGYNKSEWTVEYLDVFGNNKSSVGWLVLTNLRTKAWFMDRECRMLAVLHTQEDYFTIIMSLFVWIKCHIYVEDFIFLQIDVFGIVMEISTVSLLHLISLWLSHVE